MKFEFPIYSLISIRNPKHLSSYKKIIGLSFDYDSKLKRGTGEFELQETLWESMPDPRTYWDFLNGSEQIIWLESTDKSLPIKQLGICNLNRAGRFKFTFSIWNYENLSPL